jgi:hypothetical protein
MEEPCLLGIFYPLLQKDYFICIMSFLPLRPPHAMLEDDVKKSKMRKPKLAVIGETSTNASVGSM